MAILNKFDKLSSGISGLYIYKTFLKNIGTISIPYEQYGIEDVRDIKKYIDKLLAEMENHENNLKKDNCEVNKVHIQYELTSGEKIVGYYVPRPIGDHFKNEFTDIHNQDFKICGTCN